MKFHTVVRVLQVRGRSAVSVLLWLLLFQTSITSAEARSPSLLGHLAPAWHLTNWINSPALTLNGLRGNVVFIRWWTAPDCPYCAATAPALNEFQERFKDQGLVVAGFYHHKASCPLDPANVKRHAEELGFRFPVAIDRNWKTLRHWWMKDQK